MITVNLILAMYLCVALVNGVAETYQARLSASGPLIITQDDLLNYCGLTTEVPNAFKIFSKTSNETQQVSLNLTMDHFIGISDVTETFSMAGNLVMKYNITCWSEDFYEIVKAASGGMAAGVGVFARNWQLLFYPRMRLRNSLADSGMVNDFNIYWQAQIRNGEAPDEILIAVTWSRYGRFEAVCSLILYNFPFDTQECPLEFATHSNFWNVSAAAVKIGFLGGEAVTENSAWWMKDFSIMTVSAGIGNPSQAVYKFLWQRRPSHYIYNMFLPCFVLTILEFLAFLLPGEMPERSTYSMSVVLALVFMLTLVLANIPQTPQRIFLTEYILLDALICTICSVENLLLCSFIRCYPDKANIKFSCKIIPLHAYRVIDLLTFGILFSGFVALNAYCLSIAREANAA